MENYQADFNQSETDKYFEWTINRHIINNIHSSIIFTSFRFKRFFKQLDQNYPFNDQKYKLIHHLSPNMIDLPCKKYNTTWSQFFPIIYFIQFCSDAGISVMSLRGSAGHQEQFKHFTLLGTKLYFQTNSAKKYILSFWPPCTLWWGGGGGVVWARICLKCLSLPRLT